MDIFNVKIQAVSIRELKSGTLKIRVKVLEASKNGVDATKCVENILFKHLELANFTLSSHRDKILAFQELECKLKVYITSNGEEHYFVRRFIR